MAKRTKPGSDDREQIASKVFLGMQGGLSAFKACKAAGVPIGTFSGWIDSDRSLAERYTRAREELIEFVASETMQIADAPVALTASGATDTGAVQKQRLQVDTRKWLLSKLAPKKYGDKLELSGDPDRPVAIQKIERVIVK